VVVGAPTFAWLQVIREKRTLFRSHSVGSQCQQERVDHRCN